MGVLRNIYGYSLFVPVCYRTKELACQQPMLHQLMYEVGHKNHYVQFPLVYKQSQYFELTEWVIRGFLIQNKLLPTTHQWHYIEVDTNQRQQTLFSDKLMQWQPNHPDAEALLYGQQDDFFDKVPVECLYQYFMHIQWEEFLAACGEYFQLKTDDDYRQEDIMLINETYESQSIIRKCQHSNCFYFSDLLGQGKRFKHTFVKLRKPEMYSTLYGLLVTSDRVHEEMSGYEKHPNREKK
ncbi:hypothetical protein [Tuanshanicoccus lijuaniae]|uniref:hypothetical protein n=1 Tax=Aerococcaceae bacterium zg-1292 TaxID=2774330 RepID=UPI001BD8D7A7|nr:hypothetical protein [Aerococcaceae bacterium zg-A91]MBS4458104.1 hypothetical protein [Aerococcaceae bacterium zg-BR33]